MPYSTSNPPVKIAMGTLDGTAGPALWAYKSTDAVTTVDNADYFTNGFALGMKVGDIVFVHDTTTPTISTTWVKTVTTNGAASLSTSVTTLTQA